MQFNSLNRRYFCDDVKTLKKSHTRTQQTLQHDFLRARLLPIRKTLAFSEEQNSYIFTGKRNTKSTFAWIDCSFFFVHTLEITLYFIKQLDPINTTHKIRNEGKQYLYIYQIYKFYAVSSCRFSLRTYKLIYCVYTTKKKRINSLCNFDRFTRSRHREIN